MKALIILPTYNERETLPKVIEKILDQDSFDILVVDDNSPDGTGKQAREWAARDPRVNVIDRPEKLGLGTAYVTGFKWGLEKGYDCCIEMDSDLSHNPEDLTRLIEVIAGGNDLVIGSRYLRGTISVVGWDFHRLLLSKFGNFYASKILSIPLTDLTSGFRAYSRKALENINLDEIRSEGYSFQIELTYLTWFAGLTVKEISIIFTERAHGGSKMSGNIITEAVKLPWRLKTRELWRRFKGIFNDNQSPDVDTSKIGGEHKRHVI
ncbi:MAG: polyprenol monophosphomannose synthase [Desulfobulbaceae bacterium]|nr:polyprenol monophosphomannose synthase [Desulfobulbaceae bacterium]